MLLLYFTVHLIREISTQPEILLNSGEGKHTLVTSEEDDGKRNLARGDDEL